MKKINVNHEACIGCGACVSIDPEHFDFNDDGLSEVISDNDLDSDDLRNAMASCPTNAISFDGNCDCGCDCGCSETGECNCDESCECGCNK